MSENNPYAAPTADLKKKQATKTYRLKTTASVSVSRGWAWIAEGFELFKQSPMNWILVIIIWFALMIGVSFVPVVGQLFLMLTTYVWIGGIMLGCRAQDDGNVFEIKYLFSGFRKNTTKLIGLSLSASLLSILIMFLVMGDAYFSLLTGEPAEVEAIAFEPLKLLLSALIASLFLIPLMMMVWFAPALIMLNNVSVIQAFKLSFMGCLKNFIPFLLYGVIGLILYILALIPLALGLLVLMPTLMASIYTSYKDIFITD